MIFDTLENFAVYAGTAPEIWEKIGGFIASCTAETATGKHEICGDDVFANVQHYNPKPLDLNKLEVHRDYIDIQLILTGREEIYCSPVTGLENLTPFKDGVDCAFFRLPDKDAAFRLPLAPGNFALFFPGEGHIPGVGNPKDNVVKVVVKIRKTCCAFLK